MLATVHVAQLGTPLHRVPIPCACVYPFSHGNLIIIITLTADGILSAQDAKKTGFSCSTVPRNFVGLMGARRERAASTQYLQ